MEMMKFFVSDISGTNCYCDDVAAEEIRRRIEEYKDENAGVLPMGRWFGSGNYHYLSYFFMEQIREPFDLLLLDRHSDQQQPSFGDILSCGGWVLYAREHLSQLKEVYYCGVGEDQEIHFGTPLSYLNNESDGRFSGRKVSVNSADSFLKDRDPSRPLYISLDTDVLSTEDAACDWDQGEMILEELLDLIHALQGQNIIGFDYCGEKEHFPTDADISLNESTRKRIFSAIFSLF